MKNKRKGRREGRQGQEKGGKGDKEVLLGRGKMGMEEERMAKGEGRGKGGKVRTKEMCGEIQTTCASEQCRLRRCDLPPI